MIKTCALSILILTGISLSACTLTPSSGGYDILDPGYKAENQDPVGVPIKEASDKPRVKVTPKPVTTPIFDKVGEAQTSVKTEEKKVEAPGMPAIEPKPDVKLPETTPETSQSDIKKIDVPPPAPPVKKPKEKAVPCKETLVPPPPGVTGPSKPAAEKRITLQSGDRLKITVFREKDLTGEYQVSDKGIISFPMIGETKAAGLTPSQVQKNLTDALSKGYLVKPDVNVEWLSDCSAK